MSKVGLKYKIHLNGGAKLNQSTDIYLKNT